jgi:hypothetical protein
LGLLRRTTNSLARSEATKTGSSSHALSQSARARARKDPLDFYDELLGTRGAKGLFDTESYNLWGTSMEHASLAIIKPFDGETASAGNGGALQVESPAAVKAVYDNASELAGQDAGAPGSRGEGFNAGDLGDLDGHQINPF